MYMCVCGGICRHTYTYTYTCACACTCTYTYTYDQLFSFVHLTMYM